MSGRSVVDARNFFLLAAMERRFTMNCMDHIHAPRADEPLHHAGMAHTSPCVSELLPDFLEYLRVEAQCTSDTLLRYQKHMQAFIMSVGDSPIGAINSEKLSVYNPTTSLVGKSFNFNGI